MSPPLIWTSYVNHAIANRVGGVISPCSSDDDDDSSDDFDISPEDLPPPKLYTMAATAPSPTRRSVSLQSPM